MAQKYDSIIFDLDGTLWDPTHLCVDSWNEIISLHPLALDLMTVEKMQSVFGMKFDLIGPTLFPHLPLETVTPLMETCMAHELHFIKKQGGMLYENMIEVLTELSKTYPLFIVSNCQAGYIEAFLEYYQIGHLFKDYECPGRTGLTKAENIALIMQRNHLSNSCYVGDTEGDKQSAHACSLPFIYADYGFGDVTDYNHKIKTLQDLLHWVE